MRPHPERAPAGIRCARWMLCPVKIGECIGEGRRTPPLRSNPPSLAQTRPANPTLEGWYPRKYAYCTIYRK